MITNAELLPLCTKRWSALSLDEQNAFLNAAFYDVDVRVSNGKYVDSQGESLPSVTSLENILMIERRLSDGDKKFYTDFLSGKVSGRVYGSRTREDIADDSVNVARDFYFGLINCSSISRGEALHSTFIENNANALKRLASENE